MLTIRSRASLGLALLVAVAQPVAAAQLCPLTSPPTATVTVNAAPNSYYAGVGTATAGSKSVTLGAKNGAGTAIAVGDEILVMQMQDSAINTSNTSAYGSGGATGRGVTSDNTSGDYEYAIVTALAGAALTIAGNGGGGGLINTYHTAAATTTQGQQTFQVIRVPRYNNVTVSIVGSAVVPWNGASGGVFAIDASGTVTVTGTVNVDAAGFRGGGRLNQGGAAGAADNPPFDFVVGGAIGYDGDKGEGTVGTPEITFDGTNVVNAGTDRMPGGSAAMGSPGNAGGGGTDADGTANDDNAGGGGGSNGGDGGQGGNNWAVTETGSVAEGNGTPDPAHHVYQLGGLGGTAFAPRAVNRVVMGGGGGAGTINNNSGAANVSSSGGPGGGTILIRAGSVSGGTLSAAGGAGQSADNDAAGGGGAGGSIVVTATGTITGTTATAIGGLGGSTRTTTATLTEKHGPGGGGGGGLVISSSAITATLTGGANGTTLSSQVPFGAKPGALGTTLANAAPTSVPGVSSAAECIVNALTIAKTGTTQASPSGLVAYQIVVSNAGPGRADGTTLSDPVPAGIAIKSATCAPSAGSACGAVTVTGQNITSTVTTLPVGGSVTFTIDAVAPATPTNPYVNTATVAPPPTNTDPNPKTSTVSTTVTQTNGLSKTVRNVTKGETTGVTTDTGKPGDVLEYGLSFVNNTGTNLSAFSVNDDVPANTTFVSATCGALPAGVTACNVTSPAVGATGTVSYTYTGTLNVGQTATFLLQVKIK